MPDGEFFTGPVEDSVEGEVTFHLPAMIGGREVAGVRLRFEAGKVVDASAERGEEFLIELLDTDEGARRLGELGIGTNYAIDRGTREVLLDEKIGGTVHMAVGASYPESRRRTTSPPSTRTWSATSAAAAASRSTASRSRRTAASWSEASRRVSDLTSDQSRRNFLAPASVCYGHPHRTELCARGSVLGVHGMPRPLAAGHRSPAAAPPPQSRRIHAARLAS